MGEVILLGTLKGERQRRAAPRQEPLQGTRTGSDARTSCVRASKNLCSLSLLRDCSARLRPAAAGSRRVGGRSGSQPSLHLPSTCARGPFAARLDARALRRSGARTPKSGQLVPSGAECGASACGLTPKELARGGGGGGGDRSYLCSTQCVFAYPVGARAIGRVGARRFDAAGVSNAAPTGTVAN